MMRTLHKEKGATLRIEILTEPSVQNFITTHADTLDNAFKTVPMSDAMRRRLQRSDYIFSGIKTFHEINEAFPSLLNTDGTRKPFTQFLEEVKHIDKTYNQHYLAAEFNFAQASAAMAAKWEQYAQDGDRYLLQYRTAGDDRVRPEHASLEGVTLPITDTFWEEFYPPNGWNCRCTVTQVLKSQATPTPHEQAIALGEDALKLDKHRFFRHNSGITGKTFPDYNPYTIQRCRDCDIAKGKLKLGKPSNEVCEACQMVHKCCDLSIKSSEKQIAQNRKQFEILSNDKNYKDVSFDPQNGGLKATHLQHNFDKNKGWYEVNVQTAGYRNGHSVIFGPEPHNLYKSRKCEGTWDGSLFEIAGTETATSSNVRNALKHCASKPNTEVAILYYPFNNFSMETFCEGFARYYGLRRTSQYREFKLIVCIQGEEIIQIKKPGK